MKNYTLSLSAYSDVKKMNYEELAEWAAEIYAKGVKAGRASMTSVEAFPAALEAVLKSTYDIGGTRAKAIIKQMGKCLSGENTSSGGGEGEDEDNGKEDEEGK